jgi:GTPase SAR1 family protein
VAEWTFRACLARSRGFHIVHAGSLVRDGHGILLVGPPFAGKTTLTLALCREGFEYFSDDVGPIDRTSGRLHPFRRLAGVRATEGRRDYVAPDPGADLSVAPLACPVAWVFLLEAPFQVDSRAPAGGRGGSVEPAVMPMPLAEAALEVMRHTLNRASRQELQERYGPHPHLRILTELLDIAAQARCFRLRAGEPASTARMLRHLVDTGAPSRQD